MRATDLRIGNYVRYLNKLEKVRQIRSNKILLKSIGIPQIVYVDYIEPIELTEEILLKCGFDKATIPTAIKDIFIVYYKKDSFVVYLMNDFFEIELITKDGEQFNLFRTFKKELHILQNIYQLLENQELTINL